MVVETKAISYGLRISPEKARLVANKIRGLSAEAALSLLAFLNKKAAGLIRKTLESAIANAEHNDGVDIDDLYVKSIFVEKGPVLRRFSARAKGRGNRIIKPTSHVFLVVGAKN